MDNDAKQEREGVNVEWLAQQLLDWPDKRTDETKTMAIGALHRMASATLLSLYREVATIRQPQTDALKIAREALEPVGWLYTDCEGETSLHGSRLENGPKLGWTEARLYILKEQSK
jgi:hypothetical protein